MVRAFQDNVKVVQGQEGAAAYLAKFEDGLGDATQRVRALEAEGIVGSVIFPHLSLKCHPPFSGSRLQSAPDVTQEQRWAGIWAYNRWLADFCSEYPDQLLGIMELPDYQNFDEALRLIRWGAEAGLRGGVGIPPCNLDQPGLHEEFWEPLWSLCEELQLPLHVHGGAYQADVRVYGTPSPLTRAMAVGEAVPFSRRVFMLLAFGGVFERHPNLRFITTEQYADWIPSTLHDLEVLYFERNFMQPVKEVCPHPPRHYWEQNCAVGATFMTPRESHLRHEIGLSKIMWGSDFPHPEGTHPYSMEAIRNTLHDVPADEVRLILGENAARVYGFDLAKLRPIAERVGPTVKEVATPLSEAPPGFLRFSLEPNDRELVRQN
jgi:predicted TIM-barrel fold metal-dependent hydrolase